MRETDVTAGRSARGESNDPGRAATRGAANGGSKVVSQPDTGLDPPN